MRLLPLVLAGAGAGFVAQQLIGGWWGLPVAIGAVLAGVALVWWLRGGRGWRIDEQAVIALSPERVFDLLQDPRHAAQLDPMSTAGETISGEGVGRRDRVWLRVGRREVEVEAEVVEFDAPRRAVIDVVAVRMAGRPVDAGSQRQILDVEPVADGSRVRLSVRGDAGGSGSRLTIGARHAAEQRRTRAMLRRLAARARDL